MDGVRPLLERPLQECHHVGLVLPQLDELGLQLVVPLLKPPGVSIRISDTIYLSIDQHQIEPHLNFSFLRSNFSSRLLIWIPNHSLSTSEIFSPALTSSPWVGLPLPPFPFFLGPMVSRCG